MKIKEVEKSEKIIIDENFANVVNGIALEISKLKKGGWIQKAVNPKHKGYCTPMTKSTCTPRRKALAKTFKKHHGFHKQQGGTIQPEIANIHPLSNVNKIQGVNLSKTNVNNVAIPFSGAVKAFSGFNMVQPLIDMISYYKSFKQSTPSQQNLMKINEDNFRKSINPRTAQLPQYDVI